jgi:Fungal specific transcription factor domain/Fungal Zn(2)-Cys(6) binuclear cluster domain
MSSLTNILNDTQSGRTVDMAAPKIKRKRRRIPLSCNICRYRKMKCDRRQPCGSCVSLKMENSCHYQSDPDRGSAIAVPRSHEQLSHRMPITSVGLPSPTAPFHMNGPDLSARVSMLESHLARLNQLGVARRNQQGPALPYSAAQPVIPLSDTLSRGQPLIEIRQPAPAWNLTNPVGRLDVLSKPTVKFSHSSINYFGPSSSRTMNIGRPGSLFSIGKIPIVRDRGCCSPSTVPASEREKEVVELAEKLGKGEPLWSEVFHLLPPRDLKDFLVDRFLTTTNVMYHGLTPVDFTETLDYVYGLYERWKRKPDLKMDKIAIHRLSLVLLIIQLARLTFNENWKPSDATNNPDHDKWYLGHKLRLIPFAAVAITNNTYEGNLVFVQVLYYLSVYIQSTLGEGDGKGNYICTVLSANMIQSATTIGLHRDPDNFSEIPPKYFELWRLLWKQAVYIDTVQSISLATPPMINLKYSDTRLMESGSDYTDIRYDFDKLTLEWCFLARRFLDDFLLVPSPKVEDGTVEQLRDAITKFESVYLIPFEAISQHIQVPVLMEQTVEFRYAFHLRLYLELLHLRLVLVQACSSPDLVELVKIAIRILDVDKFIIDNRSRFPRFHTFLASTSVRANNRAWKTVIWSVLTGIQSKVGIDIDHNGTMNGSDSPQELGVIEQLDITGLLRTAVDSFKWMNSLSQISYAVWKDNFIMSNVLSHLSQLLVSAETSSNSSLLQDWESILREVNLDKETLIPPEKEWFDWILSEYDAVAYD